jgi:CheY-like chemotaxis protein/HPt (histidine-containing phosphotransfer) domain-containing protein
MELTSFPALEKGLELHSEIDPDVPEFIKGDKARLSQVISNLLGNAVKFTKNGFVKLKVRKEAETEKCVTLCFLVIDSGPGIPADKIEQIFNPYIQADDTIAGKFGGTGLGLAICKQLVELFGGEISVESLEGEGSTFWFTVRLEMPTSGEISLQKSLPAAISPAISNRVLCSRNRLLVVEDDPVNQEVASSFLTTLGYNFDVVNDGREAIQALTDNDYGAVLMDCNMPVMGGFEATTIIRDPESNVRNHATPVIALTARALIGDREMCLVAGMNDYLSKPLRLPDLEAVLNKWLPAQLEYMGHFDEAGLLERQMGNQAKVKKLAKLFVSKAHQYLALIEKEISEGNAAGIKHFAHTLKGAADTMGAIRLASEARELEEFGMKNELKCAEQKLHQLTEAFACLQAVLTERGWISQGRPE